MTKPNIRRRRGFRALSAEIAVLTKRAYGKRGLASGAVIRDWPSIVGPHLAGRCQPDRIVFPRGRRDAGILYLRTMSGGESLELQHLSPLIIDRINGHFGYRAVASMKFEPGFRPRIRDARSREVRPLAAKEEAKLRKQLSAVEDESLRRSLDRLGRAVISKSPPRD